MYFSTIIAPALLAASSTFASSVMRRNSTPVDVCPGTTNTPECCAVNVLNLADLQCSPPPSVPTSVADFTAICAAIGQEAQCCVLPVLGQALICENPE